MRQLSLSQTHPGVFAWTRRVSSTFYATWACNDGFLQPCPQTMYIRTYYLHSTYTIPCVTLVLCGMYLYSPNTPIHTRIIPTNTADRATSFSFLFLFFSSLQASSHTHCMYEDQAVLIATEPFRHGGSWDLRIAQENRSVGRQGKHIAE